MRSILSLCLVLMGSSLEAQDRLWISEILGVNYDSGQSKIEFNVTSNKEGEIFGKVLKERIRYVFPEGKVVPDIIENFPLTPVEIWYQTDSSDRFLKAHPEMVNNPEALMGGNYLIRLKGSKSTILKELEYLAVSEDLDTIEVTGNRLVFSRKPRDLRPFGLSVLKGAREIGIPVLQWALAADAFRRGIKPALIAVGWIRTGAQAALVAPTPEKGALPIAIIELATVVILEVASRTLISHLEHKLSKAKAKEGLLEFIKKFSELEGKKDDASLSLRAHYALEISQRLNDFIYLTDKGLFKDYLKYQSNVTAIIQKLRQKREAEQSTFANTMFFTKSFNRFRKVEDPAFTRYQDPIERRSIRSAEAILKTELTPRIDQATYEENVRAQLDSFMIRVPRAGLREYQKIRRETFSSMPNYNSTPEDRLNLRIDMEEDLRDAYYLYLFREEFDQAANEAVGRLITPKADKDRDFWDWLYHSQPALGDVLRDAALQGSIIMFYGKEDIYPAFKDVKPSVWFDDMAQTKKIPENALDLLMIQWSFLEKCLEDSGLSNDSLIALRDQAKMKLDLAKKGNVYGLARIMIDELRQTWDGLYVQAGAGLSIERYLELTKVQEPKIEFENDLLKLSDP